MKKLFISFCVLFGTHMAMAEVIDAVSFNPSRLGRYEHLKVTEKLDSPGGVLTQAVTLQSGGTVTLNNAGNYKVTQATVHSADLSNTALNAQLMQVRGGEAVFGAGSIYELESIAQTIRLKADSFSTYGTLSVSGVSQSDYDGNTIKGLSLGGNDIPHPGNCTDMKWVYRTDTSGAKHQVLAMQNCSNPDDGNEDPTCYGDTYYDSDSGMCMCNDPNAVWYEGYCCTYDDKSYPCWGEYWDTLCDYYEGGCYSWEDSDPYWEPTGMTSNWVGGPLACNSGYCGSCTESNIGETCIDSCWLDNDPDYGGAGYCYCETYTCWKPEEEYCEEPYYDCYEVTGFSQYFPDGGVSYYDPEEYPTGY